MQHLAGKSSGCNNKNHGSYQVDSWQEYQSHITAKCRRGWLGLFATEGRSSGSFTKSPERHHEAKSICLVTLFMPRSAPGSRPGQSDWDCKTSMTSSWGQWPGHQHIRGRGSGACSDLEHYTAIVWACRLHLFATLHIKTQPCNCPISYCNASQQQQEGGRVPPGHAKQPDHPGLLDVWLDSCCERWSMVSVLDMCEKSEVCVTSTWEPKAWLTAVGETFSWTVTYPTLAFPLIPAGRQDDCQIEGQEVSEHKGILKEQKGCCCSASRSLPSSRGF